MHQYKGYTPDQQLCEHPYPDTGPVWFITESRWYAKMNVLDTISKRKGYKPPTRKQLESMLDREDNPLLIHAVICIVAMALVILWRMA